MRRTRPPRSARARTFERLESRRLMATFTVNSFADILSPPAGVVTLRSAIQAANASLGSDTINLPSSGTYRITTLGSATDNSAGELAIFAPRVPRVPGDLTIQNTSGGTATIDGGGLNRVFDVNPAASMVQFTVTFQGLTITRGNVEVGDGGGIDIHGAASVVLNGCVVAGNSASHGGGGIATEVGSTGALTLNGTQVARNFAEGLSVGGGGGIGAFGSGTVTIGPQSLITGNTAMFKGGGGIEVQGAALAVSGATISNNRTLVSAGAQLVSGGIENDGGGPVSISGSLIEDNTSAGSGGGYGDAGLANLTVTDSFFVGNTAAGAGGAIAARGPLVTITNTTLDGNTALGEDAALGSDTPDGGGGFRFVGPGTARLTDCTIIGNTSPEFGGGILFSGVANSRLIMMGCTVADNLSIEGGGLNSDNAGDVAISNSLFRDNSVGSEGDGGGLSATGGTLEIVASRFTGNTAGLGGALALNAISSISGSTFDANRSADQGSAISLTIASNESLTNCTIVANTCATSGANGGALSIQGGTTGTLALADDTIDGNIGGGVAQLSGAIAVRNTIIAGNSPIDCVLTADTLTDLGGNLLSTLAATGVNFGPGTIVADPKLGPLVNNGGPRAGAPATSEVVPTQALLLGSPAIKAVMAHAPVIDARDFARPNVPPVGVTRMKQSIGAYEPQYAADATANQVFVENLFEVLLGRVADPVSSTNSVNFLNGGGPGVTLLQILQGSTEFRNAEAVQLYHQYFDRTPSAAEVANLANFLAAGNTPEQVGAAFIGTPEFFGDYGNNNDIFMEAVYEDTLGRAGSPGERGGWDQLIASGGTRTGVATLFLQSTGYLDLLVAADYDAFLGRPANPAEQANLAKAWPGFTSLQIEAILLGFGEAFARRT